MFANGLGRVILCLYNGRTIKKVSFISSISKKANKFIHCKRRTKVNGNFRSICVRQPMLVSDYNKYMSGVDKSDQLIGKYNSLRRTNRYWKTLFYHFLDIARVNSYIMFQEWRKCNNNNELERPAHYGQLEFSIELNETTCMHCKWFQNPHIWINRTQIHRSPC